MFIVYSRVYFFSFYESTQTMPNHTDESTECAYCSIASTIRLSHTYTFRSGVLYATAGLYTGYIHHSCVDIFSALRWNSVAYTQILLLIPLAARSFRCSRDVTHTYIRTHVPTRAHICTVVNFDSFCRSSLYKACIHTHTYVDRVSIHTKTKIARSE